jgi:hypothetical protein
MTITSTTYSTFHNNPEKIESVPIVSGMSHGAHGKEQYLAASAANGLRMRIALDMQQNQPSDGPTSAKSNT